MSHQAPFKNAGLYEDAEIVEISGISGDGEVLLDTLVNPTRSVPYDAYRIHRICDADQVNAPSILGLRSETTLASGQGSIPAPAGEPFRFSPLPHHPRVYPRACGPARAEGITESGRRASRLVLLPILLLGGSGILYSKVAFPGSTQIHLMNFLSHGLHRSTS